jgi:7-cyano-7-deazaguanine synthase
MSGGLDSCVATAVALQKYEVFGLHCSYGQRTERQELKTFNAQADFFGLSSRLVVDLDYFKQIGGSALTEATIAVPQNNLFTENIPVTYVPFRNTNFIAIATSWAEVIGAQRIFIGAVWEGGSGYTDCSPDYFKTMNRLIDEGTRPSTRIVVETPLIKLRKSQIARKGVELGAPLQLTWSCYSQENSACGTCDSCALRLRGFEEANLIDPIAYEEKPQYSKV